ncbi:MAG: hypothetical protein U0414_38560 [Polyangiaceae bacterium]
MRTARLLLGLSVAALLVTGFAGDALAKGKKNKKKKPTPADTATYFMASDPHVPLAIVDKAAFVAIETPGNRCGDPKKWATIGSTWRALDEWGQMGGEFSIASVEPYDVTGCSEATMKEKGATTPGATTGPLFVSSASWKSPKSAAFAATDEQKAAFGAVLEGALKLYATDPKELAKGKEGFQIAYFTAPKRADDGTHPTDTWAVAAGPMLVFARLVGAEWKLSSVEPPRDANMDGAPAHFKLVSIFDMDGDGVTDVIVNENNLDGWNDEVFSRDDSGWSRVVVSPGGSTA